MPRRKGPTPEDMRRAEKEIGENIPLGMVGLDTEDVGDLDVEGPGAGAGADAGAKGKDGETGGEGPS